MQIQLDQVGKRFQRHWIFRGVDVVFTEGNTYALLGNNGSGKSTLMRVIAGMQNPSVGKVSFSKNANLLETNQAFQHMSFCAPGMEIIEEFTLREFLQFHFSFKKPLNNLSVKDIITITGLDKAADKPIGDFSSGMKQRVKLAQAIFADTEVLLLDEPCTNLDQNGVDQYRNWIETYSNNRTIIVASNDVREYYFCKEQIPVEDYKK